MYYICRYIHIQNSHIYIYITVVGKLYVFFFFYLRPPYVIYIMLPYIVAPQIRFTPIISNIMMTLTCDENNIIKQRVTKSVVSFAFCSYRILYNVPTYIR